MNARIKCRRNILERATTCRINLFPTLTSHSSHGGREQRRWYEGRESRRRRERMKEKYNSQTNSFAYTDISGCNVNHLGSLWMKYKDHCLFSNPLTTDLVRGRCCCLLLITDCSLTQRLYTSLFSELLHFWHQCTKLHKNSFLVLQS